MDWKIATVALVGAGTAMLAGPYFMDSISLQVANSLKIGDQNTVRFGGRLLAGTLAGVLAHHLIK